MAKTASQRIIINSIAQYCKTIIGGLLTLYSARIVLSSLGVNDFGVFSLIAGVVSMLSFITSALSSTTQRYLSYYQGKGEIKQSIIIFGNSLYLHLFVGGFFLLLFVLTSPLIIHFLNIQRDREYASIVVLVFVALTLFTSFITSPFKASLIAHENIVFTSIIDLLDSFFKLSIAFSLYYVLYDKLIVYAALLWVIQLFNLIVYSCYSLKSYKECVIPKWSFINIKYLKDLSQFAKWNVFNILCTIGRTQGLSIVFNKFFGTVVNAAYGLGIQVSSYVNYVSDSLLNAFRPQIVKAEGAGDRHHMYLLSELASKYSFFLLTAFSIPCITEMPTLLNAWLGNVPDNTVILCRMMLLASIADSLTIGFSTANQAIGDLKRFSLYLYLPKLLIIPTGVFVLFFRANIVYIVFLYISVELCCSIGRVFVMAKYYGYHLKNYFINVFRMEILPFAVLLALNVFVSSYVHIDFRAIATFFSSFFLYSIAIYLCGINKTERSYINKLIKRR